MTETEEVSNTFNWTKLALRFTSN